MFNYLNYLLCGVLIHSFLNAASHEDEKKSDSPFTTFRLVSNAEHTSFLKESLATAERSVMISTYDVSPQMLFGEKDLSRSLLDAARRGVSIYIYYEHRPWYEAEDFRKLEEIKSRCTRFDENANHSKCIIKDDQTIAIGSYNWLSRSYEDSQNATLVFTGSVVPLLRKKVWDGIRFYQSLAYDNDEGMQKFIQKTTVFSPEVISLARVVLYTLSTPEAHTTFLHEALQTATGRILIFSPFIRLQKLQQTFTKAYLRTMLRNNARVTLVTLPSPCDSREEQEAIFATLNRFQERYANFSYLTYPNFHAKTLIVDHMICEGSYNWLCAVNNIDHEANNFEMSVALKGERGESLIQSFWKTNLGRRVLAHERPDGSVVKESKKRTVEQDREVDTRVASTEIPIGAEKKKIKGVPDIPERFEHLIRIFSGESVGKQGYCVRFEEGDYIRRRQHIMYFSTSQEAKEAAYAYYQKKK